MQCRYFDWISYHAGATPDKVAVFDTASDRRLTYRLFDKRITCVAAALSTRYGVTKGARVMLLAKTCLEAFEIQFACARVGAIFLPVNWRLTIPELTYIARDGEPAVMLYETEFAAQAQALSEALGMPLIAIDRSNAASEYEQIVGEQASGQWQPVSVDWEEIWMMLYTSGTTGHPKGAMLSYRMMYFNVLNFAPAKIGPDTTFLCAMPTFHTGGLNCYANPVFFFGGTVITMREFDAGKALALMTDPDLKVTHFFGVPSIYLAISELPEFGRVQFSSMVVAGLGGAPATDKLVSIWLEKDVPLQPAYGMTEIGPAILISSLLRVREKIGSAGQPVMNVELRIVGMDGADVQPGEIGEIWVRGPVLLSGYWKRPDATRNSFHDDWFRTGDAAWMDGDGYVYIVDRFKDMYISGGENVYPVEVENVIANHPAVVAVAVVGIADDKWGEVGCAYIIPRAGHTIDPAELTRHCAESLARYKIPKKFVFVNEFPRTASGKVLKRELRRLSAESRS